MASSGSKSIAVTSYDTLKFSWWQTSQSISNNTTTIGWKLELIATSSGRIDSTASKAWSVTINGVTTSGTNKIGISNNSTKTLASGTATIKHDSDGSKTFSFSFSQEFSIVFSGSNIGTKTGSGSGTLDVIPRKSSLTVSNGTLATSQTITVKREVSSFTHTVTYACGSASGTICTKSSSTSLTWTPPIELAKQSTATTSVAVTFTIETFNESTSLGKNTASATYAIPASVVPSLSYSVSDPEGHAVNFGDYIQNKSKVKLDITASGAYGSQLKTCKLEVDGQSCPVSLTATPLSVTSGVITSSGTVTIKVTLTDTRERSKVVTSTINVLPYDHPKISALKAYRSDSSGKSNSSGDYITVKFSSNIYALNNKNGAWYKVVYKKAGESTETTKTVSAYEGQFSVTNGTYTFKADASSYDILLKVGDKFKTVQKSVVGASIEKVFSWLKKAGKIVGMALGKIAEHEDVFDISYRTQFTGGFRHHTLPSNSDLNLEMTPKTYMMLSDYTYTNAPETGVHMFLEIVGAKDTIITQRISVFAKQTPRTYERSYFSGEWGEWFCISGDFVIEQGQKDGWTYRKWNSGNAECWKILTFTSPINIAWNMLYRTNLTDRQSYPFPFTSKPVEIVSVTAGGEAAWISPMHGGMGGVNGAYASAQYFMVRPFESSESQTFYINFDIKGKWK